MKKNAAMVLALGAALVIMIAGVSIAGSNCPAGAVKAAVKANAPATAEGTQTVILTVSNMTCGSCVGHITKALAAVDGVNDVTVSLEKGTAKVSYDESKVKPDALASAVVKAGYPAKPADASAPEVKKADGSKRAGCSPMNCDPAACGMKTAGTGEKKSSDGN